ncbi:MAG: hypothetical protein KDD47_21560 [Acidobacteria bacterium]|nr:hypothetical protein [Acidobacteriota bacterium]
MMGKSRPALALAVLAFWAFAFPFFAAADLLLEGPEFQVNSSTQLRQFRPDVADLPGGGFLVAWAHEQGANYRFHIRYFDSSGTPTTGELLGAFTDRFEYIDGPVIDTDAGGASVLAYDTNPLLTDLDPRVVYCRLDASGIQLNCSVPSGTDDAHLLSGLAVAADGSFVVSWYNAGNLPEGEGVFWRFVDSNGVESDRLVRWDPTRGAPDVTAVPGGGFYLAYGLNGVVDLQRLAVDGTPLGPVVTLNEVADPRVCTLRVRAQPGAALLTWGLPRTGTTLDQLMGQRLGGSDQPLGPPFPLNLLPLSQRDYHSYDLEVLPSGEFVVVWARASSTGGPGNIYARHFRPDGVPFSGEVLVNPSDFGDEQRPRIAVTGADTLVVVWENLDGQDGDEEGVFAQRVRVVRPQLFGDDFESGDTSSWTATLP